VIWDAHFRADDESRPVILPGDPSSETSWRPGVERIEGVFLLTLEARF